MPCYVKVERLSRFYTIRLQPKKICSAKVKPKPNTGFLIPNRLFET